MIIYCGPKLERREGECNTILFKIKAGCIILIPKHHGQQHPNVIPIAKLVEWAEREESPDDPNSRELD